MSNASGNATVSASGRSIPPGASRNLARKACPRVKIVEPLAAVMRAPRQQRRSGGIDEDRLQRIASLSAFRGNNLQGLSNGVKETRNGGWGASLEPESG